MRDKILVELDIETQKYSKRIRILSHNDIYDMLDYDLFKNCVVVIL